MNAHRSAGLDIKRIELAPAAYLQKPVGLHFPRQHDGFALFLAQVICEHFNRQLFLDLDNRSPGSLLNLLRTMPLPTLGHHSVDAPRKYT